MLAITPKIAEYRTATARLRELSDLLGSDAAQTDAQWYEQLAEEQITLMERAASLLAGMLRDEYNRPKPFGAREPMTVERSIELARQTLANNGLYIL